MTHACIKAGAALLVLGGFAVATPALALSPFPLDGTVPVFIPVQDEENEEVWKDLRPDVTPPEATVGKQKEEAPNAPAAEKPMGEGSGNIENQELFHDLETGVTPPPGE
jgi:hypothetical protein